MNTGYTDTMKQVKTAQKIAFTILWSFIFYGFVLADPPEAPAGKVWVLNQEMSDEFDKNSPDIEKWSVFDKGDSWGRTAAFDKRVQEAVKDAESDNYYLSMNPMWYYEDERFPRGNGLDYYFSGGGIKTHKSQTYGYFEVRIKPSDFPMGSGVFMNSVGTTPGTCNEKYSTELDIIENMGYTGPFNEHGDGSFNNFQHVNSHAKPFSDASGSCQKLPYESTNSGVSAKQLTEPLGFNTVGMWWKDKNTAEFYNNDSYFGTITPRRDFYLPMPLILTMETYGWGSDEKNATNPKPLEWMFEDEFRTKEQRAVVYDWVRVWNLIDIDAALFNNSTDNVKGQNDMLTIYPARKLSTTIIYSATSDRTVVASLYNPSGEKLAETTHEITKGVKSVFNEFNFDSELIIADGYRIVYDIKEGNTILKSNTSIVNVVSKPLEKKLLRDGIPTSLLPGKTNYKIDVSYETDTTSTVVIEIRKPDGSWFGGGNTNVSAGNGKATINITTSAALTIANNYFYKVYMYRKGYGWQDPLNTSISPTIYFDVEEAISPAIKILSAPTQIGDTVSEVQVMFEYATTENGTLDIDLLNANNEVIAREHRVERTGSRTLKRTIDINSALKVSTGNKIAVKFSPENGSFASLTDTLHNVSIISSQGHVGTGINETKATNLKVYPNPVKGGELHVETTDLDSKNMTYSIFSLTGAVMQMGAIANDHTKTTINMEELPEGFYLIQITSQNTSKASRFIKL